MKKVLYLGSTSQSRQMLLREAAISFALIMQSADETKCDWNLSLADVVRNIAQYKMAHSVVPVGNDGDICYVLTGDTLTLDAQGIIHGKPIDRADAKQKLRAIRDAHVITGTAFCLERKRYDNGAWSTQEQIVEYVQARYLFQVPECWLDTYLDSSVGLSGSGAIAIEGYGNLFLKELEGSYSAVIGMPMCELRESLEKLGYY